MRGGDGERLREGREEGCGRGWRKGGGGDGGRVGEWREEGCGRGWRKGGEGEGGSGQKGLKEFLACGHHDLLCACLVWCAVPHPPLLQVVYAFLMYVEFGIGEWLEERPLLYACTHQVSVCLHACVYVMVCIHAV